MYLKVVLLHTFTSLDFYNSLAYNDSADFFQTISYFVVI